jgi:hypothetical protein
MVHGLCLMFAGIAPGGSFGRWVGLEPAALLTIANQFKNATAI